MPRRGPHHSNITWLPYLRVAWGGRLGSGSEIWTNSLKFLFLSNTVVTANQATAAGPGVWAALSDWLMGDLGKIGNAAHLDWVKMNPVNGDGLQFPGDTNLYEGNTTNGAISAGVPFYQTFALTLRTGLKRGRGHSGRIFPPVVAPTIAGASGYIDVATATGMATNLATAMVGMQTAIRTATNAVGSFAVLSPGDSLKGTLPVGHIITGVVADCVPDVQHRRTRQLARLEGTLAPVAG